MSGPRRGRKTLGRTGRTIGSHSLPKFVEIGSFRSTESEGEIHQNHRTEKKAARLSPALLPAPGDESSGPLLSLLLLVSSPW
jgi:hypothetical protein